MSHAVYAVEVAPLTGDVEMLRARGVARLEHGHALTDVVLTVCDS
jgi:hypothetical protein